MKLIFKSLLFLFLAISNSYASTLIYKTEKVVDSDNLTEIAKYDASKYKKIRLAIKYYPSPELTSYAKKRLDEKKDSLEKGLISRLEYDQALAEFQNSRILNADIYSVEKEEEFFIAPFSSNKYSASLIIEVPTLLSIKVSGKGKYSLLVWSE